MLKSSEHYSIDELIESQEKELEDLKKQNKPAKNEKAIRDIEDRLTVLRGKLLV